MSFFSCLYFVFSILGCVLGAGFVSGTEIQKFFVQYKVWGIVGIIVSNVIFCLSILYFYFKSNDKNGKINLLPYCQIFIYGTMMAGLSSVFPNKIVFNFLAVVVLSIVLFCGIKVANVVNIIVSICVIMSLPFILEISKIDIICGYRVGAFVKCILYAFMNVLTSEAILKNLLKNKSKKFVICCCLVLFVIVSTLQILFFINIYNSKSEMPMFDNLQSWFVGVYKTIFVIAMISTLISSSFGAIKIFKNKMNLGYNFAQCLAISCMILLISFIGFSKIIEYIYPIIGLIFVLQVVLNKMFT